MLAWEQFYTQFKLTSHHVIQLLGRYCPGLWSSVVPEIQIFSKKYIILLEIQNSMFNYVLLLWHCFDFWFLIKCLSNGLKYVQHCQVYLNLRFIISDWPQKRNFANSTFLSHLLSIVDWWFMGTWNSKLVSKQTMCNEC